MVTVYKLTLSHQWDHCCIKHGFCHFIQCIANVNNMMTLTFTYSGASMLQRVAMLTRTDVWAVSVAAESTGIIVETGTWRTGLTLVDIYKVAWLVKTNCPASVFTCQLPQLNCIYVVYLSKHQIIKTLNIFLTYKHYTLSVFNNLYDKIRKTGKLDLMMWNDSSQCGLKIWYPCRNQQMFGTFYCSST